MKDLYPIDWRMGTTFGMMPYNSTAVTQPL